MQNIVDSILKFLGSIFWPITHPLDSKWYPEGSDGSDAKFASFFIWFIGFTFGVYLNQFQSDGIQMLAAVVFYLSGSAVLYQIYRQQKNGLYTFLFTIVASGTLMGLLSTYLFYALR